MNIYNYHKFWSLLSWR